MNIKSITAVAIGALMLSPIAASADNVAASLSASFGTSPTGTVDVGATTFATPQSLSVAAAAGGRVVAGSAATPFSSGAAAGAGSAADDVAPYASVTNNAGAYEVTVAFAEPGLFAELALLQAEVDANTADIVMINNALDALQGDITDIQTALNDVCSLISLGFTGTSGDVTVNSVSTVVTGGSTAFIDLGIFGSFTVFFDPTSGVVQSMGTFTPEGEVNCTSV